MVAVRQRKLSTDIPLTMRNPIIKNLYGANTHVIDLGENYPEEVIVQADLKTNAGYGVGILFTDAPASTIGTALNAAITGSAFGNQPSNDGVEVLSDEEADVSRVVTLYGTINGTSIIRAENVTLNDTDGRTQAVSAYTDWGAILGVEVDAAHATATITIREASSNQAITTIAAETTSTGVTNVAASLQDGHGLPVQAVCSDTGTKVVGIVGTKWNGDAAYDAITLSGATAVNGIFGFDTITKLLTGDVEATRTATFKIGNVHYGAAQYWLTTGVAFNAGLGRRVNPQARYLHAVVCNGATLAAGGVADLLRITPFS